MSSIISAQNFIMALGGRLKSTIELMVVGVALVIIAQVLGPQFPAGKPGWLVMLIVGIIMIIIGIIYFVLALV